MEIDCQKLDRAIEAILNIKTSLMTIENLYPEVMEYDTVFSNDFDVVADFLDEVRGLSY